MQQLIQLPSRPGFRCSSCGEVAGWNGKRCVSCNFDLHTSCATVNMAEERTIRHPSHPKHLLSFFKNKNRFTCAGCGKLGQSGYGCVVCKFYLDTCCATVHTAKQLVVQHPIHPGHRLTYARYPCGFQCSHCGEKGRGNGYGCVACDFDLHITCAMVKFAEEKGIQHPKHPRHCLSFFKYKNTFICGVCKENGRDSGYGCAVCNFDLHISCATVNTAKQSVIQHPIHQGHRLAYVRYAREFKCNGCGEEGCGNAYGCVSCTFSLHISCATVNMDEEKLFVDHQLHPGHRLRYVKYTHGFTCNDCGEAMRGNGYRCSDCDFDLHESCAVAPSEEEEDLESDDAAESLCGEKKPSGKIMFLLEYDDPTTLVGALAGTSLSD